MASLEVKTNLAHEKKKLFKCEKCKKKFISEARLKWHLVTIHEGNNPYQCIHCKKNFSFKKSLKTHVTHIASFDYMTMSADFLAEAVLPGVHFVHFSSDCFTMIWFWREELQS